MSFSHDPKLSDICAKVKTGEHLSFDVAARVDHDRDGGSALDRDGFQSHR